jgi:hypothetical protein
MRSRVDDLFSFLVYRSYQYVIERPLDMNGVALARNKSSEL